MTMNRTLTWGRDRLGHELLLAAVLLYFVGAEQGATSLFSGAGVHEFVHDGRHLLGFPCH